MRALYHVLLAGAGGGLLGALDAAVGQPPLDARSLALSAWLGFGSLALLAMPVGFLQALVLHAWQRVAAKTAARQWHVLFGSAGTELRRRRVVQAHAIVVVSGVLLVVVLVGTFVGDSFFGTIQIASLRRLLLLATVAAVVSGAALAAALAIPLATLVFTRLDARLGLPWPRSAALRVALFVVVPSVAVSAPILARYGAGIGFLLPIPALLLFLQFQLLIHLTIRESSRARAAQPAFVGIAMVGVVGVVALPLFVQRVAELRAAGSRGNFIPAGIAALTRFTDVDGDGFSSLYFGGDCAPFNARMHRAAVDAAGNGRDENCDGSDANVSQGLPREPVSAGHWRGKPQPRFNVLWIVVDALRADATSFQGYARPTTPGLSRLASQSLVFENAYAQSSTTHLSISSMLTGKIVERMSWEYARDSARLEADERHRTLPQRLSALKYRSAAIVSAFIARLPSLMRGFDQVITGHRRGSGYDGPGASAAALDLIHASARLHESSAPSAAVDPFFLFAYYEDPHMPYSDHGEGYPRFGTSDRDLYDGEIAYVDRHIAAMLEHLESHPSVWDNTVVVLTADHGEEFGEHGSTAHGKSCYRESTHVPLLIRVPGMAPRRIAETVSLVDVVPTLLEAAGASEYGDLDGRSLLGAGAGTTTQTPSFCAITNQGTTLKGRPFFERSVRYGNRSLVERSLTGELELFDSRADGAERHNIAAEPDEAATVAELKRLLTLNAAGNFFDLRLGGPSAQLGARYSSTRPPEQGAAH